LRIYALLRITVAMKLSCRLFLILALTACTAPDNGYVEIARGTVLSVGKNTLVMQDKTHAMFVSLSDDARERLKHLRKGETVILMGTPADTGKKSKDTSMEIDEIVLKDGTHIPL
jgi:hypothetical protein